MFQSFWTLDTHLRFPCGTKTYYLIWSELFKHANFWYHKLGFESSFNFLNKKSQKKWKWKKIIHFLFSSKNSTFLSFCFSQNLDKKPKNLVQVDILSRATYLIFLVSGPQDQNLGSKTNFNLSTYRSTDITDNVIVFLDFVISEGDVYFFPALFFNIFNAPLHF